MRKMLLVVVSSLFANVSLQAQEYKTVCGELYKEEKAELECWLEVGTRRPVVYMLDNVKCEFYAEGKKYCASGYVEKGYTGELRMHTLVIEDN